MQAIGMPATTRLLYGGGPWFHRLPPNCEVWAYALMPAGVPRAQSDGAGKPTIIAFKYGQGDVILFSYHPSVLVGTLVDGVYLRQFYQEGLISWNWGNQTTQEVNLNSWNILHAALKLAARQSVTRLTKLPQ